MSTSKDTIDNPDGLEDMILFTLGNFGQNKAFSLEILQNCVTLIGVSMAKTKIIGNCTWRFLHHHCILF